MMMYVFVPDDDDDVFHPCDHGLSFAVFCCLLTSAYKYVIIYTINQSTNQSNQQL